MIAEFSRSRCARSGSKAPAPDEVDTPTGEAGGEGPAEAKSSLGESVLKLLRQNSIGLGAWWGVKISQKESGQVAFFYQLGHGASLSVSGSS